MKRFKRLKSTCSVVNSGEDQNSSHTTNHETHTMALRGVRYSSSSNSLFAKRRPVQLSSLMAVVTVALLTTTVGPSQQISRRPKQAPNSTSASTSPQITSTPLTFFPPSAANVSDPSQAKTSASPSVSTSLSVVNQTPAKSHWSSRSPQSVSSTNHLVVTKSFHNQSVHSTQLQPFSAKSQPLTSDASMSPSTYQGLVEPASHFQSPMFMSPQVVDPLMEDDPIRSNSILMDYMHVDSDSKYKPPFYEDEELYKSGKPPGEDFGYAVSTEHDLAKIYEHLQNSHPEVYHDYYRPKGRTGGHQMIESKRPVAQNMLFSKHDNYYMPFKVNTVNVYAKYLDHGAYGKCPKHYRGALTVRDVQAAVKYAASTVEWYENTITSNALETNRRTPYIPNGVLDSKVFEYASQYIKKKKCFNKMDVITVMPKIDVTGIVSRYEMNACQKGTRIMCDSKAKYRSIDGSCNNLKMKTWSQSFTCHRRLLPPDYADGVAVPRVAHDGSRLPNARDLSSLLLPDINVQDHKLTSMVMSYGQFIIHDITRTLPTSNDIKCCPTKSAVHPECMGIDINRKDDVLFRHFNQTCLNFVRSIVCNPCSLGPREQQNQATHTFDMSHMYGLRLNDSLALRTFKGGQLRSSSTSTYPKEELPPKMAKEDPSCNVRPVPPRFKCFESSDGIRASQHPALQALHVAFHRRHNMHAAALAKVNPHWDDEKLYQEARRILIAEESKITYDEYLPAIFGKKLMKHFRLGLNYKGYTKYDSKLNPSTIQEFIVAAGRFGHSQINDQFRVLFKDKKMSYSYSLRDNFFETTIVSLGHSGGILKGLATDSTEASDPYFVDDIKNSLYHLRKEKFGRDLPAFNVMRGRDHGIPGYIYYLDFCFGYKVKSWADLITFIPKKQLKKLQIFYKHWKDIDLFIGGVSERLIAGAAFGPTFACINGIQFYNFKYGDRFYFEHGYQSGSFTPAQLDNIKRVVSLSSIICKTNPEVEKIQYNSFIKPSPHHNPLRPCYSYPEINYLLWMDKKRHSKGAKHGPHYPMKRPMYRPKPVVPHYGKKKARAHHYNSEPNYSQYHHQYPHKSVSYMEDEGQVVASPHVHHQSHLHGHHHHSHPETPVHVKHHPAHPHGHMAPHMSPHSQPHPEHTEVNVIFH